MHKRQNGFLVFEFLIYLFLSILLVTLCLHWAINLYVPMMFRSRQSNTIVSFYAACDLIARDIRMAPSDRSLWKKIDPSTLIWHTNDGDIGWFYNDQGKLTRFQGSYDATAGVWHKKVQSTVLQSVDHVSFTVSHGNKDRVSEIQKVACVLKLKGDSSYHTIAYQVAIRNRKIL